jgi:thiamine biosynthesis lipoprotein
MVADGLAYGDSTGGMFDVTIFPVKELWGLGENSTIHKVPSSAELSAALRRVNYHKVRVSTLFDTIRFADSSTAIDAGGFAKGYALIQTAQILDRSGFHDYLVAAGDIVGRGRRKDGTRWCIGIQNPRTDKLLATVTFDTGAVFTSGDYENFWMDGDRRIHHIFNPRTGYSCTRNQSVTIRSDSPIQAKYLSTGLFSFSADSIISYVKQRGLDCVVVDSTGRVFVSPGWKDRVTLTK